MIVIQPLDIACYVMQSFNDKTRQYDVASSSTEAKYCTLAGNTTEIIWLCSLLEDMGVTIFSITSVYCDNHIAIELIHNDVFYKWTKNNEVD